METNVISGRTQAVGEELKNWLQSEDSQYNDNWIWAVNEQAIHDLLEKRKFIPFRDFMIRYILAIHKNDFDFYRDGDNLNEVAEELILSYENNRRLKYSQLPEKSKLKILVSTIYQDFIDNEFYYIDVMKSGEKKKVYGTITPDDEQKIKKKSRKSKNSQEDKKAKKAKPKTWSATEIYKKIMADRISEDDFYVFAFGLKMDYEDIKLFMQKALRRAEFNIWNADEFLKFFTLKYARGNLYEFYKKAYEYYQTSEAKKHNHYTTSDSTITVRDAMDEFIQKIKETNFDIGLDEDGELSKEIQQFLQEYKFWNRSDDVQHHVTTAVKRCSELLIRYEEWVKASNLGLEYDLKHEMRKDELAETKESIRTLETKETKETIRAIQQEEDQIKKIDEDRKKAAKEDPDRKKQEVAQKKEEHSSRYARGRVWLYYDPEKGMTIPTGATFKQIVRKKGQEEKEYSYIYEGEPITIAPQQEVLETFELPVECTEQESNTVKQTSKLKGYVPANCVFTCKDKDIKEYVIRIENASKFKSYAKDNKHIAGKLRVLCRKGVVIPAGTKFSTKVNGVEKIFKTTEAQDVSPKIEIWVRSEIMGEDAIATKNTITEHNVPDCIKIENGIIGFSAKKANEKSSGGIIENYLYHNPKKNGNDLVFAEYLTEDDFEKLALVLQDTRLDSAKISQIKSKKPIKLTREQILTICFLYYTQELEYAKEIDDFDNDELYRGFMDKANDILQSAGYYPLYAPNPYDSLLVYLLTSKTQEAYQDLWACYLSYEAKKNKTTEAKEEWGEKWVREYMELKKQEENDSQENA